MKKVLVVTGSGRSGTSSVAGTLKRLGFHVHVVLPYGTLINYLRVLGLMDHEDVCTKAWGYLNDA